MVEGMNIGKDKKFREIILDGINNYKLKNNL